MNKLMNITKHHRIIKVKPGDVQPETYIEYGVERCYKDRKFKFGDHVRISKCINIFTKGCTPNWSEEVFVIKKVKDTVPWACVLSDVNGEEIGGTFYEKEWQKTNHTEFRVLKVIKRKGDRLYVKWKGYGNYYNIWIKMKDLV